MNIFIFFLYIQYFYFHGKVIEFMRQYDVHNEHVIKRTEFLRGLDQLRCNLSCTEMGTIMDIFQSPLRYTIYITYVHLIHIYRYVYIYILYNQ